ncbi:aromatic amino acid transport family protein [Desulfovibrio inopinatus]|uniref:aromatic amino acid transport family protein n=1 Tax=Desulfovibrio inopinatus TaxID=102109 RepID=UPI00040047DA|nr:aromatic amino acid transport family protein [Desulfovibrio inopinatus]
MRTSGQPVLTVALMVTGNLLGAGILALPINLGPAGILPATVGIILVWALMLLSSYILADQKELVTGETGGLPSFFALKLGPIGKWVAVVSDLIILYGVLTAYLVGVTSILVNLFNLEQGWVITLGFFVIVAGLTSFGTAILRRCNAVIMIVMVATFLVLSAMVLPEVDIARAMPLQWGFLPAALPVVLTAFLYHNLIPTVCRELGQDRGAVRKAMYIGSLIGLVMNLSWTVVVFCALPMEGPDNISILHAFQVNLPATVPLSKLLQSSLFTNVGLVFAILSMTAAFMANGVALLDFLKDLSSNTFHVDHKLVIWIVAFIPPLFVSLAYPDVFLVALNVVGGIGVCIFFGILPSILLLRQKSTKSKMLGWIMLVLFGLILLFELGQEFGLTHIDPDVDYWIQQPFGG